MGIIYYLERILNVNNLEQFFFMWDISCFIMDVLANCCFRIVNDQLKFILMLLFGWGPVRFILSHLGLPNEFQHPKDQLHPVLLLKHFIQQYI